MDVGVSGWELAFSALVIVVAFTVRGAAGFGGGALATTLLALVFPVHIVVPVLTVLTFLASIEHGVRHWDKILWAQIAFLTPSIALGVGAGLYLLGELDAELLRKALGGFVVAYAIFAFVTSARPVRLPAQAARPIGAVLGAAASFVATLFGGAAGPLFAMYYGTLALAPPVFRVTMTTTLLMLAGLRITGYTGLGLYDRATLTVLAVAVPFMWVGGRIADRVADKLAAPTFNRFVGATLLLSGAVLLLK